VAGGPGGGMRADSDKRCFRFGRLGTQTWCCSPGIIGISVGENTTYALHALPSFDDNTKQIRLHLVAEMDWGNQKNIQMETGLTALPCLYNPNTNSRASRRKSGIAFMRVNTWGMGKEERVREVGQESAFWGRKNFRE